MSEPTEMRRVVLTLAPDTVNASADPLDWDWNCILSGLIKHVQASETWIHIAVWEHKDGTNTRAFLTEEGAQKWKEQIAAEWWETEISDETKPEDSAEAAELYFELMGDVGGGSSEYFNVFYENLED